MQFVYGARRGFRPRRAWVRAVLSRMRWQQKKYWD